MITQLHEGNIEEILDLEKGSFIPQLQAEKSTILKRLGLGHSILGNYEGNDLVAMVSYLYTNFNPRDPSTFPKTHKDFSLQPIPENPNAVVIISLGIKPERRARGLAQELLKAVGEEAKKHGCLYGVADGRCPSYNGSPQEDIKQNPEFKNIIGQYLNKGIVPSQEDFLKDPLLAFYHRTSGCGFLDVIPDFFPEDEPSGGLRVILYKYLDKIISLSKEWSILARIMYGQEYIEQLADFLIQSGVETVLECGCGDGYISKGLAERGLKVTALDSDPEMVYLAFNNSVHPNVDYKLMNWLDLDKLAEKFDCVICRGNSISSVSSWGKEEEYNPNIARERIKKSIGVFFRRLKDNGMLYVDTTKESLDIDAIRKLGVDIAETGGGIEFEVKREDFHLKGKIEHDLARRTRRTYGRGTLEGEEFSVSSTSYLMTPGELEGIIRSHNPSEIWIPNLPHERYYHVICAMK